MGKLWGSRFKGKSDQLADHFSFSLAYDHRLIPYDCLSGIAHVRMLKNQKILPAKDANQILKGLKKILKNHKAQAFDLHSSHSKEEDVHTYVQSKLNQLIGPAADKLHTARSRNDLVVTDMKLYIRDTITETMNLIKGLQFVLLKCAEKYQHILIPAYTHLQSAQVVTLAHYLLAYIHMLDRDKGRLKDALARMNTNPLGSCALSGTTLPIDRMATTKELGFSRPSENSIDDVSDRDFIIEILSHLAIMGMHFSRMAEDLIVWSTSEFDFIDIDESFCTGSSIMPHKKNPDILELIRGQTAMLYSNLNQTLILLKGLPLTYHRDFQLDKPPLFSSIEKMKEMITLLEKVFATLKVKPKNLNAATHRESLFSVDIMEYLIHKGVSYRQAHDVVGMIIKDSLAKGQKLSSMDMKDWKKYSKTFSLDIKKLLNPEASVKRKKSLGSTHPKHVARQIRQWKKSLHL